MGTTAQKLQAVANSKAAIKAAIEAKGVSDVGNVLSTYATKIASIPVGGGDPRYEVTAQGALNKKSFVIDWFDDLTSIPNGGLYYAYYQGNATSASFPNLTSVGIGGMSNAFSGCTSLTSVSFPCLTTIDTNGFSGIFYGCTSLTSVDLSSVTSIGNSGLQGAFRESSLTSIDLSGLTSNSSSTTFNIAFMSCRSLTTVDLSNLTSIGSSGFNSAFSGCTSLKTVLLKKLSSANSAFYYAFQNCTALELVDFSEATSVPALNTTNAFTNTNNTFKIVVPDALYNDWIVATNWSTYASQIVKVSDYTPTI